MKEVTWYVTLWLLGRFLLPKLDHPWDLALLMITIITVLLSAWIVLGHLLLKEWGKMTLRIIVIVLLIRVTIMGLPF